MAFENSLDDQYVGYMEQKEPHFYDFFYSIPKTPLILIGIAVVLLIIFFMKNLSDQMKTYFIIGIALAVVIIITLTRSNRQDYLEEGAAIKIVKEYLVRKREEVPSMDKKKYEVTGVTQLQQWDVGGGMQPWRWAIAYNLRDDVNCERFVCYINPWDGKIIGTALLPTQFVGKESPNIKISYPLQDRSSAKFRQDVQQNRSKW